MPNLSQRRRGRPLTFDRDAALDRAIETFWAKGYNATSLDDLTESMGINRPSLYGSFGKKHDLFMQAIDRYAGTTGHAPVRAFLDAADIHSAVEAFFESTIRCTTSRTRPPGCLIMNVAGERAANDPEVRARMDRSYKEKVDIMAGRLRAARAAGELPDDTDPDGLARMIVAVMHGLAARARVGASRRELSQMARDFLDLMLPRADTAKNK